MDWLAKHKATIDCEKKLLMLTTLEAEKIEYWGSNLQKTAPVISATRAFKMIKKGCQRYMCAVEMSETQEPNPKEISMV